MSCMSRYLVNAAYTLRSRNCVLTNIQNLERIIVRDFFPDHGRLKDQKEYLEAEERKDFEKMREVALKYSAGRDSKESSNMQHGNLTACSTESQLLEYVCDLRVFILTKAQTICCIMM